MVKNPPASARDVKEIQVRSLGQTPGLGNGNPLQYSCLETPMDRVIWRATVHGVTQSQTQLKRLNMNSLEMIPQDVAHKKDLGKLL